MTDPLDRRTLSAVIAADELLAAVLHRLAGHMEAAGLPAPPTAYTRLLRSCVRAQLSIRTDGEREVHLVLRSEYAQPWVYVEQDDDRGDILAMGSDADGLARWLADWMRMPGRPCGQQEPTAR